MPFQTSYKYDEDDTSIYVTDLYSGVHTDIDDTERYTDDIDLSVYSGAQVDFKFTPADATDDLVFTLYKRRNSSWSGNEIGWKGAVTVENAGSEAEFHYTIPENYQPGHYRFGLKSSSSTTTFDIEVKMRTWRKTRGIS